MPLQVTMPQLGETEGDITITRWLHGEGDAVREFEPLVEVDSALLGSVIPCPADGTLLKIDIPAGSSARPGTILGWVRQQEEDSAPQTAVKLVRQPEEDFISPAVTKLARQREEDFISPAVAKLARQWNVDLNRVKGSGEGGRVTRQDVLAYIQSTRSEDGLENPAELPATEVIRPLVAATGEAKPLTPAVEAQVSSTPAYLPPILHQGTLLAQAILAKSLLAERSEALLAERSEALLIDRSDAHLPLESDPHLYSARLLAAVGGALSALPTLCPTVTVHFPLEEGGEALAQIDTLPERTLKELVQALQWAGKRKTQPNILTEGLHVTLLAEDEPFTYLPPLQAGACAALCIGAPHRDVVLVGNDDVGGVSIRQVAALALVFDLRLLNRRDASRFLAKLAERLGSGSAGAENA